MTNLSVKERVIARRVLRLARLESSQEELDLIDKIAKRLGLELDPADISNEQREIARASNRRPGRTPGLRRSFAG